MARNRVFAQQIISELKSDIWEFKWLSSCPAAWQEGGQWSTSSVQGLSSPNTWIVGDREEKSANGISSDIQFTVKTLTGDVLLSWETKRHSSPSAPWALAVFPHTIFTARPLWAWPLSPPQCLGLKIQQSNLPPLPPVCFPISSLNCPAVLAVHPYSPPTGWVRGALGSCRLKLEPLDLQTARWASQGTAQAGLVAEAWIADLPAFHWIATLGYWEQWSINSGLQETRQHFHTHWFTSMSIALLAFLGTFLFIYFLMLPVTLIAQQQLLPTEWSSL